MLCISLECLFFHLQEKSSLVKTLATLKDLPEPTSDVNGAATEDLELAEPLNITGLETFSLSYKVLFRYLTLILYVCFYSNEGRRKTKRCVYAGAMASLTCNIKESFDQVPIDFSAFVSLQACQPPALYCLAIS